VPLDVGNSFVTKCEIESGNLNEEEAKIAEAGKPILGDVKKVKVIINESQEFKNFIDKMIKTNTTSLLIGSRSWQQQFHEAITLGGGETEEGAEAEPPTCMDYFMHYVTLPWKVIFALVPPTEILNGWACFVVSIFMIGLLTAFIGDLASHFGCTVGLKDSVTAISLVALGTSLPDTFASKVAAVQDEYADSSIVNVTGSNAVNVFLGIGIAWAIASIYHAAKGTVFYVETGSLAFSVTLFCIGAVVVIAILQFRRYFPAINGELGGPAKYKYACSAIFLTVWILYLLLSSLETYCIIGGF